MGDGYQPLEDTPEEVLLHRNNQALQFDVEVSAIGPGNWNHINGHRMAEMESFPVPDESLADFVPNDEMYYRRGGLLSFDTTIDEVYQEPSHVEDISMRGFWQPRRFY